MRETCLVLVLGLAGCGTMHFVRPGGDNTAFQGDWTACEVMCNQAGYAGIVPRRNFMERWMVGKGWTRSD